MKHTVYNCDVCGSDSAQGQDWSTMKAEWSRSGQDVMIDVCPSCAAQLLGSSFTEILTAGIRAAVDGEQAAGLQSRPNRERASIAVRAADRHCKEKMAAYEEIKSLQARIGQLEADNAKLMQPGGYAYMDKERTEAIRKADTAQRAAEHLAEQYRKLERERDALRMACEGKYCKQILGSACDAVETLRRANYMLKPLLGPHQPLRHAVAAIADRIEQALEMPKPEPLPEQLTTNQDPWGTMLLRDVIPIIKDLRFCLTAYGKLCQEHAGKLPDGYDVSAANADEWIDKAETLLKEICGEQPT
jgi:hypothetical protein